MRNDLRPKKGSLTKRRRFSQLCAVRPISSRGSTAPPSRVPSVKSSAGTKTGESECSPVAIRSTQVACGAGPMHVEGRKTMHAGRAPGILMHRWFLRRYSTWRRCIKAVYGTPANSVIPEVWVRTAFYFLIMSQRRDLVEIRGIRHLQSCLHILTGWSMAPSTVQQRMSPLHGTSQTLSDNDYSNECVWVFERDAHLLVHQRTWSDITCDSSLRYERQNVDRC